MKTALEILVALAKRYAFGEVAALTDPDATGVQQLCAFGQRLLDLDAEDFGIDAVPPDLRSRALECRMPQAPNERHRGALGSLRPAYSLLLEVVEAHWRRRQMTALVATVHISSEYGPLLAWEPVLGNSGDPARLADAVGGPDSVWGEVEDASCPHTRAEKSAANRVLRVAQENPSGWRSYLDRQHSNTAHALAVCAVECERPCSVMTRLSTEDEQRVADGCRLALAYVDSPVVRLRHSAPVGHGFGVPSPQEVLEAWQRSREHLAKHDRAVLADDDFPLPGLPALFTALAGVPIEPGMLLADTADAVVTALTAG